MTVSRTLNGKPITEEDLHNILLWNPTIESICTGVIARIRKHQAGEDSDQEQTLYGSLAQ